MSPPTRRRRFFLALPAIGFGALILFVSSRPAPELPATGVPSGDKLLHVAEYFVYGLLLALPVRDLSWRGRSLALAVGLAYAAFDEAFQSTVPGRFGDVTDWAADAFGLLLAVMVEAAAARAVAKPV